MSTVSMTVNPRITHGVGVPRGVFVRFPQGNIFGEAGRPDQHRAVLEVALQALVQAERPGTIFQAPFRWRRFPR